LLLSTPCIGQLVIWPQCRPRHVSSYLRASSPCRPTPHLPSAWLKPGSRSLLVVWGGRASPLRALEGCTGRARGARGRQCWRAKGDQIFCSPTRLGWFEDPSPPDAHASSHPKPHWDTPPPQKKPHTRHRPDHPKTAEMPRRFIYNCCIQKKGQLVPRLEQPRPSPSPAALSRAPLPPGWSPPIPRGFGVWASVSGRG